MQDYTLMLEEIVESLPPFTKTKQDAWKANLFMLLDQGHLADEMLLGLAGAALHKKYLANLKGIPKQVALYNALRYYIEEYINLKLK